MGRKLRRLADWSDRLTAHLARCAGRRYQLGDFDCCLFVADAVEAMTGQDIAARFRGYTTKRGGLLAIRSAGFRSVRGVVAQHFEAVAPEFVGAGDLVFFGGVPGVCQGRLAYVVSLGGLGVRPLVGADGAFRI